MEVHRHAHPGSTESRKKWSHYFWEFLMLFLAVFCGFLAEYQLEHKIEKDREKQYMRSLINDLKVDLLNIRADQANRRTKIEIADSLAMLFREDYSAKLSFIYFFGRRFSVVGPIFHMTDGTLMQLRNSGGLRLIRKQAVVDSLQGYYNLFQQYEDNRELDMLQLRDYRDIMVQVFDVNVFDEMIINFPTITIPKNNPPLLRNDKSIVNQLLMRVQISKRNSQVSLQQLKELEVKAEALINQISTTYRMQIPKP